MFLYKISIILCVLLGLCTAASLIPRPDASLWSAVSAPLAELDMEVAATAYRVQKSHKPKGGLKHYDHGHHEEYYKKHKLNQIQYTHPH